MPDLIVLTWEQVDRLVASLAESVGRNYDVVLAISRGGLVPAGMLAYRLDLREILVASVRGPMHIVEAARMGADICTCPASVIEACFKHPLTDIGLEKFMKDWASATAKK